MAWTEIFEGPFPGYISLFYLVQQETHFMGPVSTEFNQAGDRRKTISAMEHHPLPPR